MYIEGYVHSDHPKTGLVWYLNGPKQMAPGMNTKLVH
jgi:hypothetical protein